MFKILIVSLNKQKIVNNLFQIRTFKRPVVPSDFDVEHHKHNLKENNNNDPIPYFMEQINKKKEKENYDIENEKWCTNEEEKLNDRED